MGKDYTGFFRDCRGGYVRLIYVVYRGYGILLLLLLLVLLLLLLLAAPPPPTNYVCLDGHINMGGGGVRKE